MDTFLHYTVKILGVLAVFAAGFYGSRFAARFTHLALEKARVDITLTRFAGNVVRWVILILVTIACLGAFGIETTSFAAVIGAASLAIGLAFQGTLSSVAAGALLLALRPFRVGDVITIAGNTGKVFELGLFAVSLDTIDNRRIIVPNSAVIGATIENATFHATRRMDVNVSTSYSADLDKTRAVLLAATQVEGALTDPAPAVALLNLGNSAVEWQVRVFARTEVALDVKDRVIRGVKMGLDAAGIEIPYPQLKVQLDR